jgi:Protein-tyrosine-phosphatase
MIKILFVCHGNICRSPMAEFVFKDIVKKAGKTGDFLIASAGTDTYGSSPPHNGTKSKLKTVGITIENKFSARLIKADYGKYDYIIGMDRQNVNSMYRLFDQDPQHKVFSLLEFADISRGIDDPWYTGDYDKTYDDVLLGCQALYNKLVRK